MGIIVQKFGGSSLCSTQKLFSVCKHIKEEYDKGSKVVVVVSAQGKTTNRLIKEELEITSNADKREHDVLVSVGEQISAAKLVMCLKEIGYKAISFCGWQIPIITDNNYGDSNIKRIELVKILSELNAGKIVVVAGFQGIDTYGNITTLGRGGSDTTAVAIAASLNAEKCYIYTDVDGIYNKDPNAHICAVKYETISYDDMLTLSNNGAKVLHNKCIGIGKEYNVPIIVKSTFRHGTGTVIQ